MVISGGENVFPAEIENLLVIRGDVRDAAVLGVAWRGVAGTRTSVSG